jgi:hypothetical protein
VSMCVARISAYRTQWQWQCPVRSALRGRTAALRLRPPVHTQSGVCTVSDFATPRRTDRVLGAVIKKRRTGSRATRA